MKRIAVLISIFLLLSFTCNADSSYIDRYISENDELSEVISAVIDYGGSGLPYDESEITVENLVRVYKFNDKHLPNYFNENGSLFGNITDCQEYKHFSSIGFVQYIGKNDEMNWEVYSETNELRHVAEINHGISFEFKDMMTNISEQYPDYNYESVRYIEYHDLATNLVYFTSANTEYIAYYPFGEDEIEELVCGEIYTVEQYIDLIDDYPIFNNTEPYEGAGGGVGVRKDTNSASWYIYTAIGITAVAVIGAVVYVIVKRKKAEL